MGAISGSTGGSKPLDKKNGTRKRTGTNANSIYPNTRPCSSDLKDGWKDGRKEEGMIASTHNDGGVE